MVDKLFNRSAKRPKIIIDSLLSDYLEKAFEVKLFYVTLCNYDTHLIFQHGNVENQIEAVRYVSLAVERFTVLTDFEMEEKELIICVKFRQRWLLVVMLHKQ